MLLAKSFFIDIQTALEQSFRLLLLPVQKVQFAQFLQDSGRVGMMGTQQLLSLVENPLQARLRLKLIRAVAPIGDDFDRGRRDSARFMWRRCAQSARWVLVKK